jgi:hypothetical protein
MKEQRVIGILAMDDGGPFAQTPGQRPDLDRAWTQEFHLVHASLHLDNKVFVGIRNYVDIAGRTHLGYERIIAGRANKKIRDLRAHAEHVHEIEASENGIAVNPPE